MPLAFTQEDFLVTIWNEFPPLIWHLTTWFFWNFKLNTSLQRRLVNFFFGRGNIFYQKYFRKTSESRILCPIVTVTPPPLWPQFSLAWLTKRTSLSEQYKGLKWDWGSQTVYHDWSFGSIRRSHWEQIRTINAHSVSWDPDILWNMDGHDFHMTCPIIFFCAISEHQIDKCILNVSLIQYKMMIIPTIHMYFQSSGSLFLI